MAAAAAPPPGDAEQAAPARPDTATTRLDPAELGALLVTQRESAGMSVDDVASRTRIRPSLIESMEAGRFAPCGGAVYARGHLRSIAHVVGADDTVFLAAYDRMSGQPSPSATRVADEHYEEKPAPVPFAGVAARRLPPPVLVTGTHEPGRVAPYRAGGPSIVLPGSVGVQERRSAPWVLAAGAVLGAVVILAAVLLLIPSKSTTPAAAIHPRATPSTPVSPVPTAPTTMPPVAAPGVTVTVKVAPGPSWVHVVDSTGRLLFQGVVSAGTTKSFHAAQQLQFVFGNARAVTLTVNGHLVGVPPTSGGSVVSTVSFGPTSAG